jgi:branched-subunit amino acid ABC-type transport system permease component
VNSYLPFIISGLASGSVFGLTAVGLVVTYRTSGLFNFAHGAIASVGAFAFYELRDRQGVSWPLAALVCVVVVGPLTGLVLERLAAALAPARLAMKVVATVGLILLIYGITVQIYGATTLDARPFLPQNVMEVGGVNISVAQVVTFGISAGLATVLLFYLRRARLGVAMRGVVDDPALLDLTGLNPVRVRRLAWMMGSTIAVASGILIAPLIGLDTLLLTLLVVQSFGAAAIGRFSSLPATFAGGLAIGVAENLLVKFSGHVTWLALSQPAVPFVILFVVLLLTRPSALFDSGRHRRAALTAPGSAKRRLALDGVILLLLFVLPQLVGVRLGAYTNGLISAISFLALGLLVWTTGQVSLCHASLLAVGATTAGHLVHGAGLPWLVALVVAGLAAVPLGIIVAIPAIRLSGIFLALATFGFGVLMQYLCYDRSFMFGQFGQTPVPRPSLPSLGITTLSTKAYFYIVLVAFVAVYATVSLVLRARLGRLLTALADSPVALLTHGTPVNRIRLTVFCLYAFLTGIAGALSGSLAGTASDSSYGYFSSLTLLAVLALFGTRVGLLPALAAGAALTVIPTYLTDVQPQVFTLVFGASAIFAGVTSDRPLVRVRMPVRTATRLQEGASGSRLGARRAMARARPQLQPQRSRRLTARARTATKGTG